MVVKSVVVVAAVAVVVVVVIILAVVVVYVVVFDADDSGDYLITDNVTEDYAVIIHADADRPIADHNNEETGDDDDDDDVVQLEPTWLSNGNWFSSMYSKNAPFSLLFS